jgi:DNA polymerase-3 subunit delta
MRLNSHQLPAQLRQSLPPVIMVSGDEPLQKGEALDAVRLAARQQEFTEREIIDVGNPFDWSELAAVADNLSLFGDKRLIELRLSSAKIGNDGGKAIQHYIERPPEDTCLLITCPRLERAQNQSKWVKAIEQQGILVTVWPLEHKQLPGWLQQRMNALGLKAEPGAAQWLAERVEGNLLAAVQELEKLMLLQGPGPLSLEQMMASASDSARYTVFDLADAALAGEPARTVRIIRTLQAEGSPQPLVLWALSKEIRLLAEAATEARHGGQAAPATLCQGDTTSAAAWLAAAAGRLQSGRPQHQGRTRDGSLATVGAAGPRPVRRQDRLGPPAIKPELNNHSMAGSPTTLS